jgi:hypothetical protein
MKFTVYGSPKQQQDVSRSEEEVLVVWHEEGHC